MCCKVSSFSILYTRDNVYIVNFVFSSEKFYFKMKEALIRSNKVLKKKSDQR